MPLENVTYPGMCSLKRPCDDQEKTRIQLETQAKLKLPIHVDAGSYRPLWRVLRHLGQAGVLV